MAREGPGNFGQLSSVFPRNYDVISDPGDAKDWGTHKSHGAYGSDCTQDVHDCILAELVSNANQSKKRSLHFLVATSLARGDGMLYSITRPVWLNCRISVVRLYLLNVHHSTELIEFEVGGS